MTPLKAMVVLLCFWCAAVFADQRDIEGLPNGYLGSCPIQDRNLTIPPRLYKQLLFVFYGKNSKGMYKKHYNYLNAEKIMKDPDYDPKKKLIVFISGYFDSTNFPFATFMGDAYTKRTNYNVILLDTNRFTTFEYAVATSIAKDVALKVSIILTKMHRQGLKASSIELIGLSLGCHTAGLAAKHFQHFTGKKVSRITGLDPSGPCFRHVSAEHRLDKNDADFVDIIHTNVDGFGMPMQIGHVDFYVNGAEWQPAFVQAVPCLVFCSHVRAYFLFIASMDYQDKFIALRCNSIQQAKDVKCFDNHPPETTIFGFAASRTIRGIFYLGTTGRYPYYLSKKGVIRGYDHISNFQAMYNNIRKFPST